MTSLDRSLVANLPLFAGFSAGELDEILRQARSVRVAKNDCKQRTVERESISGSD